VRFTDGTELPEVLVEYPLGHARRRGRRHSAADGQVPPAPGPPLPDSQQQRILAASLDPVALAAMPVTDYVDLYLPG
jgi:2-methylcitrate dehydratase